MSVHARTVCAYILNDYIILVLFGFNIIYCRTRKNGTTLCAFAIDDLRHYLNVILYYKTIVFRAYRARDTVQKALSRFYSRIYIYCSKIFIDPFDLTNRSLTSSLNYYAYCLLISVHI